MVFVEERGNAELVLSRLSDRCLYVGRGVPVGANKRLHVILVSAVATVGSEAMGKSEDGRCSSDLFLRRGSPHHALHCRPLSTRRWCDSCAAERMRRDVLSEETVSKMRSCASFRSAHLRPGLWKAGRALLLPCVLVGLRLYTVQKCFDSKCAKHRFLKLACFLSHTSLKFDRSQSDSRHKSSIIINNPFYPSS